MTERGEDCVGAPVRDAGGDQEVGRDDAADRLAQGNVAGNQGTRHNAHAKLVAAVADTDGAPGTGAEQPVEGRGEGGDAGAAHVSRDPVGGGSAALDGDDPVDAVATPEVDDVIG